MLEKIFGKKSTGIVYILCAAALLLCFAGSAAACLLPPRGDLHALIGQAVFTAFSLALISLPVFIQKKCRLYIPPLIELGLCAYFLLSCASEYIPALYSASDYLPAIGGSVLAMAIFSVLYSYTVHLASRGKKRIPIWLTAFLSFLFSAAIILLATQLIYAAAHVWDEQASLHQFLVRASYFMGGSALTCAAAGITAYRRPDSALRILNFKNAEEALLSVRERQNKTQAAVIENIAGDCTDYKKLYRRAKAKFLCGRIVYLFFYAGYLVYAFFALQGGWGHAILFALFSSFILTAVLSVWEYILFRKDSTRAKLRGLKIARAGARLYALVLVLIAMFYAGYRYDELNASISVCMAVFNLCSLFYNLFSRSSGGERVTEKPSSE